MSCRNKDAVEQSEAFTDEAERLAAAVCRGFRAHDRGDREEAIEAFSIADRRQFAHLPESKAREASVAYANALFAKDDVEIDHLSNGGFDQQGLAATDWTPVSTQFRVRASIVGMDPEYAELST